MSEKTKIESMLGDVRRGCENVFDVIRETIEFEGEKVPQTRIILSEKFTPLERKESPRRAHTFQEVGGFVAYLKEYGGDHTVVLADVADPDLTSMDGILDEESPDGFEKVTFNPRLHPLLVPWIHAIQHPMELEDFADLVTRNRRTLVNGRDLAMMFAQVKCSIKTEVQKGFGKKSVNGVMTTFEINGQVQSQPVDLPESITLECPIFVGTPKIKIDLDLVIKGNSNTVVVSLGDSDFQVKRIEAVEDFVKQIRESGLMVSLGRAINHNWDYVGGAK
jgi:hypothetical protein